MKPSAAAVGKSLRRRHRKRPRRIRLNGLPTKIPKSPRCVANGFSRGAAQSRKAVLTSPSIRRRAREAGIDLTQIVRIRGRRPDHQRRLRGVSSSKPASANRETDDEDGRIERGRCRGDESDRRAACHRAALERSEANDSALRVCRRNRHHRTRIAAYPSERKTRRESDVPAVPRARAGRAFCPIFRSATLTTTPSAACCCAIVACIWALRRRHPTASKCRSCTMRRVCRCGHSRRRSAASATRRATARRLRTS